MKGAANQRDGRTEKNKANAEAERCRREHRPGPLAVIRQRKNGRDCGHDRSKATPLQTPRQSRQAELPYSVAEGLHLPETRRRASKGSARFWLSLLASARSTATTAELGLRVVCEQTDDPAKTLSRSTLPA